ncbi:Endonuclease-reverse transcriptase [Operophtera brumata]|uniref:Endonuclease-reverse transcriptase n=1 Tax=Operophtera brumata TaxID=104452 RepID=A0A0L7LQ37_OPEBR|nr:Endonuclease-reverse transcriptase [Operophtera brumata]
MIYQKVRDKKEIDRINKEINKEIKKDIRKYNSNTIIDTIKAYQGPKVLRRKTSSGAKQIMKLKDDNGNIVTDRNKLLYIVEKFYEALYASRSLESNFPENDARAPPLKHYNTEILPRILPCEVTKALCEMKTDKSPGDDGMTVELFRAGVS